jgi:hypothetical protein
MKTLISLLVFVMFLLPETDAQLFQMGSKWIIENRDYSIGNGNYFEKFDSIVVVSDTIINELIYKKLKASQDHPCGIYTKVEYLREKNNKVYRLRKNLINEDLMIDFTNQNSYLMNYAAAAFNKQILTTVVNDAKVNEILPSGRQLELRYQRILNNSSFGDNMVYKLSKTIGYIDVGLLFPNIGTGLCDVRQVMKLRCKMDGSDTTRLTNLDCYQSSLISSLNDLDESEVLLYPNPTSDIFKFNEGVEITSIYNLSGSKMDYVKNNNQVDISALPKGIYFVTTKSSKHGKMNTSKVVKL